MLSKPARSIVSLFSFFAVGWQCTFPYSLFGQAKKKNGMRAKSKDWGVEGRRPCFFLYFGKLLFVIVLQWRRNI